MLLNHYVFRWRVKVPQGRSGKRRSAFFGANAADEGSARQKSRRQSRSPNLFFMALPGERLFWVV